MQALKGKALKRAMATKDVDRIICDDIPLIQDKTELITVERAQELLRKNKNNRPVNWGKVAEFTKDMLNGKWTFHAQGIILDKSENILTGQKRLWAIVHSGVPQYMRVSRGSPPETADFIDRGVPQSSRDLAARKTSRKHSPMEASIVRAILAMRGNVRPNTDQIAKVIVEKESVLQQVIENTRGIKKTKAGYMVLGVICEKHETFVEQLCGQFEQLADIVERRLAPVPVDRCWNKGAAFSLAMDRANELVDEYAKRI
jgi:hypothetical protein